MKQDKTNFIIFGQGRSGSSLLKDLLDSHPEIDCLGDFLHKNQLQKKFGFFRHLIAQYPIPYIYYFKNKSEKSIFGFKLFNQHVKNIERTVATLYKKEWKIIHLHRENILKQSISWAIANQTSTWARSADTDDSNNKTYKIDPKLLLKHTGNRLQRTKLENQLMTKFDHLDVIYEYDLFNSDSWPETTRKVVAYLGIYPVEVQTKWLKTDQRPDSERISNFDEVMDYMKNNGFADLVSRYKELSLYY